jgi:hypothetical protein
MIEDAMETADHYYDQGNGLLFGAWRRKVLIERNPLTSRTGGVI